MACVSAVPGAQCARAAGMRTLDAWYAHLNVRRVLDSSQAEVEKAARQEGGRSKRKKTSRKPGPETHAGFSKLTGEIDGVQRIVADPPLIVPIDDLVVPGNGPRRADEWVRSLVSSYRRSLADEHHPLEEFTSSTRRARSSAWAASGTRLDPSPGGPRRP